MSRPERRISTLLLLFFIIPLVGSSQTSGQLAKVRELRTKDQAAVALRILKPYDSFDRAHLSLRQLPLFLEQVHCQHLAGSESRATRLESFAFDNTDGAARALVTALSGDRAHHTKQWDVAIKAYQAAIKYGDSFYKPGKAESPGESPKRVAGHETWPAVRKDISARLAICKKHLSNARNQAQLKALGSGFIAYREARKLQLARKFPAAIQAYSDLLTHYPDTVYADAATLYRAQCRQSQGEHRTALRDLGIFYKTNPKGLYRGEALALMGQIELLHNNDANSALEWFSVCVRWCEMANALPTHRWTEQLPAEARKVSRPPTESQRSPDGIRLLTSGLKPDAIVNRDTTPYYLRDIRREAHWLRGFIKFHLGDYAASKVDFDRAISLNPVLASLAKRRVGSFADRIEAAIRVKFLVTEPTQLQRIGQSERLPVQIADFFMLWEKFPVARQRYNQLLESERTSPEAKASALIGLSHIAFHEGDREKMTRLLKRVDQEFPRTNSHPIALLALGSSGKIPREEQDSALLRAYKLHPRSPHAVRAYFNYGFRNSDDPSLVRRVMSEILRRHPKDPFAKLAREQLQALSSRPTSP